MVKRVLVTGANGLLGQAVVNIFTRESDIEIISTSVEENSYLDAGHKYIKLDITNKSDVKKIVAECEPDVIVNCAAFTDVDKCETERETCWKLNVDAVKNLIIASRPSDIKFIHYSTDYIFDGKNGPYKEDATPNPVSFYGRSKLASENALTTSGIDYAIIRTMVLFGVGVKVKPNFAYWLINELKNKKNVNIVDDMIGNSTIVDDLAYGSLKIVESGKGGVFNIAGKDIETRLEFAFKLCDVFNFDKTLINVTKTKNLNQAAARPLNSGLITFKAETELGLKLMDTIESLRLLKYQMGY